MSNVRITASMDTNDSMLQPALLTISNKNLEIDSQLDVLVREKVATNPETEMLMSSNQLVENI